MDELKITRDDLMETLQEVVMEKVEIPTKTKTAFTREYNKTHDTKDIVVKKRKTGTGTAVNMIEVPDDEDLEEDADGDDENFINNLEEDLDLLDI